MATRRRAGAQSIQLKQTLDALADAYISDFQCSAATFFKRRQDPVLFAHRYEKFHDREAAAFIAATFAYGNVQSLCRFIDALLGLLSPSPSQFLRRGPAAIDRLAAHKPYYRLHKAEHILAVLRMLSEVYSRYGSLSQLFYSSYYESSIMEAAIQDFVVRLRGMSEVDLKFLIPAPGDGSPCKRLNLFLRWMVRRDGVDLGLWTDVRPADLVMPVDTHIGRVAYRLGWIGTPSLSWRKAQQITDVLRHFNPQDPTRYDFALCHESIAKSPWLQNLLENGAGEPPARPYKRIKVGARR